MDFGVDPSKYIHELGGKYFNNNKVKADIELSPEGYDMYDMYIYIKESIKEVDEEKEWSKKITIEQDKYNEWNDIIKKVCLDNEIDYKEPSWYLMVINNY
jgi:hypothetical protein